MSIFRKITGVVLGSALLVGCATPKPRPPAITNIASSQVCVAEPSLTNAIAIPYKPEEKATAVSIKIDRSSQCLQANGGKSLYKVLKLPDLAPPYIATVRSLPHGQGIFSPTLSLLDKKGNLLRTIDRDKLTFRGSTLSALFRIKNNEKYLIAVSNNDNVGKSYQHIDDRITSTQVQGVGGWYANVNRGSETVHHATYSHGGILEVSVRPISNRKAQ